MRNTDCFKGKKIAVIGLARSGLFAANLLCDLGAQVWVTDKSSSDATKEFASKIKSPQIRVELGKHTPEFIQGKDLVVISPGVTNEALPVVWARQQKIPVISEIELGWILCPAEIIAVTGSSGKTTVTTLIGKILEASGKKVFVCGNIGNPFCSEVHLMEKDGYVVLEVSSFQLVNIEKFKPKVALILNFTRNHLDWHKDMQEYLDAKKRIFMNQDNSDYLVLNQQDSLLRGLAKEAKGKIVYFEESEGLNPNQAAVCAVGSLLGVDKKIILKVLGDFKGIEHRMEFVANINGVNFINDSKATTADSTLWALKNINNPIVLIAGGKDKGVDYSLILNEARHKVREAVLIGEARGVIAKALKGAINIDEALTFEEAVKKAFLKAKPGDSVLLSPMCSSFDMFSNYEERGRVFKKLVLELEGKL
ncbi:MAG: UDP-N-acetylmuramoyl-L-alanine--D-glutamate ligase [Candidatus Omnitrophica bacterium]|nr:UDP-N-acetylmuramoyl-L-alanine--D-glutamate ligase [Candidatus Omnitrophota bacterium]